MTVYFYNKDELKTALKNTSNNVVTVRFKTHKSIDIPKPILNNIRYFVKSDKKFMKTLISSENNFILFLLKFINQ